MKTIIVLATLLVIQALITLRRERKWKNRVKVWQDTATGYKTVIETRDAEFDKADQAAQEWLKARNEGELGLVYTSKSGYKFYGFTDFTTLPAKRGILAEMMGNMLEMNITRESLLGYLARMKEAANNGKITELFADIERISDRLSWVAEENTLLAFAKIYFVLEGENIEQSSMKYSKLKDKIFEEDEGARSFFLCAAFRLTKNFSDISDKDILAYLTRHAKQSTITK